MPGRLEFLYTALNCVLAAGVLAGAQDSRRGWRTVARQQHVQLPAPEARVAGGVDEDPS